MMIRKFLIITSLLGFLNADNIKNTKNNNLKLTETEIYKLSYKYETLGKYNKAIKALLSIRKIKYSYLYYYRLGWLYFLNKQYKKSINELKKTFKYYPNSIESKLLIIRSYLALGKYSNMLNMTETILRKDYYNYYGNYYEALGLYYVGKYKVSVQICLKMLSLYPRDKLFLEILKKNYIKQKNFINFKYINNLLKIID